MNATGSSPLLDVHRISKRFVGVDALRNVDLSLSTGEVLAVVGENGAGKSTLMKILAGVQVPSDGEILVDGKRVKIDSCRTAMMLGIVLIHQELNLADNLDVGANIFLGREPLKYGLIDNKRIYRESRKYLKMVGLDVDPTTVVKDLSIGQQQMVEIAKALSAGARVLIMDEPTSSLSTNETTRLFEVVKELRNQGVSIIYISHRLAEVKELADRVTVLRDGENAGVLTRENISHDNMVRLMVGRELSLFYTRKPHPPGDRLFHVHNLVTSAWPQNQLNFSLRRGEIVGIAGLVGAGRSELLQVIFGIDPAVSGSMKLNGHPLRPSCPDDSIRAGIALVPEDRKQHGVVLRMSIRENIGLAGLQRNQRPLGFLNRSQELNAATKVVDELSIKTPGLEQSVRLLSGGNQQKVVLGKWLALSPKLLLLDEPTRGIDVGAKREIYALMEELARNGVAILFASSEMEEILGMSDRVLVMHEGKLAGELDREMLTEEAVMQLATGNTGE